MTKKGALKEWFSQIKHGSENPNEFSVVFRDFNKYIELPFNEFSVRQQEDSIPLHRISQIRKQGTPVYTRPNYCTKCGNILIERKCSNIHCLKS
jgi:uncharacterized protein (UPF0248 family)